MTYADLKRKIGELTETQLAQDVRVSGEDRTVKIALLDILDENYVDAGDDYSTSYSDACEKYGIEAANKMPVTAHKNDVFLVED